MRRGFVKAIIPAPKTIGIAEPPPILRFLEGAIAGNELEEIDNGEEA
jgi:hypothetical protein